MLSDYGKPIPHWEDTHVVSKSGEVWAEISGRGVKQLKQTGRHRYVTFCFKNQYRSHPLAWIMYETYVDTLPDGQSVYFDKDCFSFTLENIKVKKSSSQPRYPFAHKLTQTKALYSVTNDDTDIAASVCDLISYHIKRYGEPRLEPLMRMLKLTRKEIVSIYETTTGTRLST